MREVMMALIVFETKTNPDDVQIRGRGGGGGHPDPEISRGVGGHKKIFRPSFLSKNVRRGVGEGLPWIGHCYFVSTLFMRFFILRYLGYNKKSYCNHQILRFLGC